jgi:ankyrin repeat protein
MLEAVKSGDVKTAKILFKYANYTCTTDDEHRDTPLTYAGAYGNVEVVRVLLEGGANVNVSNVRRNTALHNAALNGNLDVCRLLLDWGAKVDSLNMWNSTPLHFAAWKGHLSVVKLLVERGADVRLKNDVDLTASELARKERKEDVADWLDSVSRG